MAGVRTPILNKSAFCDLKVRLPPLPIQRRIAGTLSVYDELIENNQRRIKTLESMARALYRESLGSGSNPVAKQPIIEAPYWRFISENICTYSGTKRYYATADIDGLAITGQGIDYSFTDRPSRAQKQPIPNSVWFARMKDTYKIAWYGPHNDDRVSGVVLSSGFAGFEARDMEMWPLLFLTISSKEFHAQKDLYCTGATQMSLNNEGLARIALPFPEEDAARWLGRNAGPILNAISGLQETCSNLRRTRDLLLPRLLSGQIDSSKAQQIG
jgi:type I restriction enzyme S subunit